MGRFTPFLKNRLVWGLVFLAILGHLLAFAYNTLYQRPLILPDQTIWSANRIAVEARELLAKRWNTDSSKVSVLALWETGTGTSLNLLHTDTMSGVRLFLPIGNSMNPIPQHPYYREVARTSVGYLSASFGTLYITDEYLTKTSKERAIVRNYYAGKYPWLNSPTYKVMVRADPKHGWFRMGDTYYSIFLGIPIDFLPLLTSSDEFTTSSLTLG